MKHLAWAVVIFSNFTSLQVSADVTLRAAYDAALSKNETVRIQQSRAEQADERVSQAKGALWPKLSASATYLRQHIPDEVDSSSTTRALSPPDQTTAKITLTQPLFQGFKEFAGLRLVNSDLRAQQAFYAQEKVSLYASVAQAYFDVLTAEHDLQNITTLLDLTNQRVKELRGRTKVGRTRKGDLLSALAQASTLKAQVEEAKSQLEQRRNQFQFVTGLPRESKLSPSVGALPKNIPTLESYLSSIDNRPDIAAYKAQLESAEEGVDIARGGHWPTIDFTSNYYLKRPGVLENSKWDLGLTATLPIFEGGVVLSQVREASEKERELKLTLYQNRRAVEADVRTTYRSVISGLEQIESLQEAVELSKQNYQEQSRDYRYGLATNLDVLQALNSFQENKRSLDRARFQVHSNWASLQTSIGRIP